MLSTEYKTVLVAGGTGLIGRRLSELLESKSYRVLLLTRNRNKTGDNIFYWDPEKKIIDANAFKQADVIINLAGEGIADHRWTARRKRKIINSRIIATNFLYETVATTSNRIELFVNASAVGIYGDTGDMIMLEDSPLASDFLGQTCQRWEAAARQFEGLGIRTVIFRIGIVLDQKGGMLAELNKPLKLGIAPVFGNGCQYMSWIHIDDLCKMMSSAIRNKEFTGVFNAVSPGPLSNKNFIKLLSHILGGGHFIISIPAIFLKLLLGEMSKMLLETSRISCRKIEETGFVFKYPQADMALRNLFGK